METIKLSERHRDVFKAIVAEYIGTAEPVGSRTIARNYSFKLSPATIRNVMADLEDLGLVAQPHTSAGRVPTNLGFRYFVNSLLKVKNLSSGDREEIRRQGPILLGSVVVFGLATIAFGLSRSFILTMLALIFIGAADTVSMIIRNTIRQLQTPDYIRGRMVSVNQLFFMGGPQLGEIEAGVVAQLFGTPFAVISGGIGCILGVVFIARRWPQLHRFNGDEPILAGDTAAAD